MMSNRTETETYPLAPGDIVEVRKDQTPRGLNVPEGSRATVARVYQSDPDSRLYIDVAWQNLSVYAPEGGWFAERFEKVASLYAAGTTVYLTKDSRDGKYGIAAYPDDQWPLRGTVETSPVPTLTSLGRGYTVRLDDESLVFATQRMLLDTPNAAPVESAPPVDPEVERLGAEVRRLQNEINRMIRWKDTLVQDAHEYADDSNLCEKFDRFMEEHGLPSRRAEHEVEVEFVVKALVRVEARSEEEARAEAEQTAYGMRVDIDAAIERETSLERVDTIFDNSGGVSRLD